MELKFLLIGGGAIVGYMAGHSFAALFDIRSRDHPDVPHGMAGIIGGILGAIAGGAYAVYYV